MYSLPMRANKLETALSRDHLACQAPPDMVFTRVLHACSHRKIGTRHVFDNINVSYFAAHEESEFEKVCCKYLKQKMQWGTVSALVGVDHKLRDYHYLIMQQSIHVCHIWSSLSDNYCLLTNQMY